VAYEGQVYHKNNIMIIIIRARAREEDKEPKWERGFKGKAFHKVFRKELDNADGRLEKTA
jgi:hypothetical protein